MVQTGEVIRLKFWTGIGGIGPVMSPTYANTLHEPLSLIEKPVAVKVIVEPLVALL